MMKIRVTAVAAGLTAVMLAACSSSPPAAGPDALACRYFAAWVKDGQPFSATGLLGQAMTAAGKAVPHASTVENAAGPPRDRAGRLAWDLSNVYADATEDTSPPIGFASEIGAVQGDCINA